MNGIFNGLRVVACRELPDDVIMVSEKTFKLMKMTDAERDAHYAEKRKEIEGFARKLDDMRWNAKA